MEAYLPSYCYSKKDLVIEAIVIHFFSVANVQPKDPYDLTSCEHLMHDLNVVKSQRVHFLKGPKDKENPPYGSAHALISRGGLTLLTVPENKQAYHAGVSFFKGRKNWNSFSYGIELIGTLISGFTDAQYESCAKRCYWIIKSNPNITLDWIVGHEEISPGRKVDPGIATGNFDMVRLKNLITKLLSEK